MGLGVPGQELGLGLGLTRAPGLGRLGSEESEQAERGQAREEGAADHGGFLPGDGSRVGDPLASSLLRPPAGSAFGSRARPVFRGWHACERGLGTLRSLSA